MSNIKHLLHIWLSLSVLFCSIPALCADDMPIIAAAASIKFALQEIATAFRQDTGKSVRFSFSSSGNLTRQIQQGAPFQLFLSANKDYIEQLQQLNLTQGKKIVFAHGRLALLTTIGSSLNLDPQLQSIKQALQQNELKRFAIANPEHAPYGAAAKKVLQHQQLWSDLQPHLVLGENVAQAAQFASSGAAQAGLISYSLALAPALKNTTRTQLVPQHFHEPLEQTMTLLNNASTTTLQFYQYILQDKSLNILSRYGYTTP